MPTKLKSLHGKLCSPRIFIELFDRFPSLCFFSSNDFVLKSIQFLTRVSTYESWLKSSPKTSQKPDVCEMRIQLRFTKFYKKKCSVVFLCIFQSLLLREFKTIRVASIFVIRYTIGMTMSTRLSLSHTDHRLIFFKVNYSL